jgi:tetratricopeptide (TPR) repeat protein
MGRHLSRVGKYDESTDAFKRALGPTIATGDRPRMLDIYRELAQVYVRLGTPKTALTELQEGLDMCTLGEGPRAAVDFPIWRYVLGIGTTFRAAGELVQARTWCDHALFQAERGDDRLGLLRVHAELAGILRELDQQLLAEQHLARALEEARHFGDRLTTAELLLERARTRATRGKLADAERCCREALRLSGVIDWRAGIRHAERALEMLPKQAP